MNNFTVGIIGCGNMGGAIAKGMVASNVLSAESIFLYDKDIEKAKDLAEKTGCALGELSQMVRGSEVLIIAVKPQDSDGLLKEIAADITDQTIVSVMAGVRINSITGKLGKEVPVVRAMPNMAAFVSESITSIACNSLVKRTEEVKSVFAGIGEVVEVEEGLMDAVTAVSGSGPAYLFHLAEAMVEAAIEVGFDTEVAEKLVVQTLYGSSLLLRESKEAPADLIKKVSSKGGTTEAALTVLEKELKDIMKAAIKRAKERSEELSKG
ncbi:MAG: pyrroline-5-carboxylate reductase [Candidatus Omnitrophota bacterium]